MCKRFLGVKMFLQIHFTFNHFTSVYIIFTPSKLFIYTQFRFYSLYLHQSLCSNNFIHRSLFLIIIHHPASLCLLFHLLLICSLPPVLLSGHAVVQFFPMMMTSEVSKWLVLQNYCQSLPHDVQVSNCSTYFAVAKAHSNLRPCPNLRYLRSTWRERSGTDGALTWV